MTLWRSSSNPMEAKGNTRKRVCKACDRCRLKKSKCDGAKPCNRCKADNAICVFGERKKSQDKAYPKGYVEMLEEQQAQLVAGLQELYTRLKTGQGWPGQPLLEEQGGHPLTHDILERLDLLHQPSKNGSSYTCFEEDCGRMQRELLESGATLSCGHGYVSSRWEHGNTSSPSSHSEAYTTRQCRLTKPFADNKALPGERLNNPASHQLRIAASLEQESQMVPSTYMETGALVPSAFSPAWVGEPMLMDEPVNFRKSLPDFGTPEDNSGQVTMLDPLFMATNDPMISCIIPYWNNAIDLDPNIFI